MDEVGEPEIFHFDNRKGRCSVLAIDLLNSYEIMDVFIVARGLMEKHDLLDLFLCDHENAIGYNIKKGLWGYETTINSLEGISAVTKKTTLIEEGLIPDYNH